MDGYSWVVKTYCFDIDGTICITPESNYHLSSPLLERIAVVNKLFDSGNDIHFFTARGAATGLDWRELTETQLNSWGVKYHKLIMGKRHADLFIDDKAMSDTDFFKQID